MAKAETIPNTARCGFLSAGEAGVVAQPTDPIFAIIACCQLAYEKLVWPHWLAMKSRRRYEASPLRTRIEIGSRLSQMS